jgi:Xaa-Pro aminopeptidase
MQLQLRPGISEQALWAHLHAGNIARGGEWIETRLLASGPRTNPWFQECSSRPIEAGELVAFDTDLIGPYGYCADISRTWLCGADRASAAQGGLYRLAREHFSRLIKNARMQGCRILRNKAYLEGTSLTKDKDNAADGRF